MAKLGDKEHKETLIVLLFAFVMTITTVVGIALVSVHILGENYRDITSEAISMLENREGFQSTREVRFKLGNPVVLSVNEITAENLQLVIEFNDSEACEDSVTLLVMKYPGELPLTAESISVGSEHVTFAAPIFLPSLSKSARSLCEISTTQRIPLEMHFSHS